MPTLRPPRLPRKPRIAAAAALLALALAFMALALPVSAGHEGDENPGTLKVHDEMAASPPSRNEPHVDCEDFWIEGFGMLAGNGALTFYSWPPHGDREAIMMADWMSDGEDEHGRHHFLAGPFTLPAGHYKVEAGNDPEGPSTDDGEGDGDDDGVGDGDGDGDDGKVHSKTKTFWVESCQPVPPEERECPADLAAAANGDGSILLSWTPAPGSSGTNVLRAVGDGDFEYITTVEGDGDSYLDADTEVGTTYAYMVTAFYVANDCFESTGCDIVEATAIPVFPSALAAGLGVGLGLLAYVGVAAARRRKD